MSDKRYRSNTGSVYSLKYHLVWCPKYRRKVLVDEIADELRSLLYLKAQELNVTIEALEIMPDHVPRIRSNCALLS
jgi:putative transposase